MASISACLPCGVPVENPIASTSAIAAAITVSMRCRPLRDCATAAASWVSPAASCWARRWESVANLAAALWWASIAAPCPPPAGSAGPAPTGSHRPTGPGAETLTRPTHYTPAARTNASTLMAPPPAAITFHGRTSASLRQTCADGFASFVGSIQPKKSGPEPTDSCGCTCPFTSTCLLPKAITMWSFHTPTSPAFSCVGGTGSVTGVPGGAGSPLLGVALTHRRPIEDRPHRGRADR